ncbi:MAG: carboxypeptidase-like regulatory domain-containing protein, partial [Bacteroidota bacterium]
VILLNKADSVLTTFALTNNAGKFKLEKVEPGKYLLQVTYLGYNPYSNEIEVLNEDLNIGNIKMLTASNQLDEVIVKEEHIPITAKKDTIVYNADAFKTQPNDVVEDLLRKMPGIEVEQDGSIKAQGEDVEQVLVDGKEFFGKDPKVATKNLPASAIDKVEVFDQKSDQAEFSGIDDGERTKTINLELKEDAKKGTFGLAGIGYGTEDRYKGNISLNRFNKNLKYSIIGNFNNINEQGFSVDNYISFMGGIGGFMGGGRNSNLPISNGLSDGFVTTNAGGLNLNYNFGKETELNVSYFLNDIDNTVDRISTKENLFTDGSLFTQEFSDQNSKSTNHSINLRFETEFDSTSDIRIRSSLTFNDGGTFGSGGSAAATEAGIAQNNNDYNYRSDGNDAGITANATFRKKIGKKAVKILTLNGSINDSDSDNEAFQNSENIFFPDDPLRERIENFVQRQIQTNDRLNYSIRSTFSYPLKGGKYFELTFNHRNIDNDLINKLCVEILT